MIKNIFLTAIIFGTCLPAYGVDSILVRINECNLRISGITEKTPVSHVLGRLLCKRGPYHDMYLKVCRGPWFWQEKIVCADKKAFIRDIVEKYGSSAFELWRSDFNGDGCKLRCQRASQYDIGMRRALSATYGLIVALEK